MQHNSRQGRSQDLNIGGPCKSKTIICVKILHDKGVHSTKINICDKKAEKNKEKLIILKPLIFTWSIYFFGQEKNHSKTSS